MSQLGAAQGHSRDVEAQTCPLPSWASVWPPGLLRDRFSPFTILPIKQQQNRLAALQLGRIPAAYHLATASAKSQLYQFIDCIA